MICKDSLFGDYCVHKSVFKILMMMLEIYVLLLWKIVMTLKQKAKSQESGVRIMSNQKGFLITLLL